jgi:hypothetical protein
MQLTQFTKILLEYLFREREKDHTFSNARLAKILGVHRATVGRWLKGQNLPEPQEQTTVLFRLGILGNNTGTIRNAKVIGRLDPIGGRVEMAEQLHEPSIPIPYLEFLLNAHPLWELTKGDPFLLCLEGPLPGYELANMVVARRPADASLHDIPPGSLAIVRLAQTENVTEYGFEVERVVWRWICIVIHRISQNFPYLNYSKIGVSSGSIIIMMPNCFEIMGLLFELPSPDQSAVGPS